MDNEKCLHTYRDGTSAIIFPRKVKWLGVYPSKVKGVCKICNNTVEISEKEYKKIKKG